MKRRLCAALAVLLVMLTVPTPAMGLDADDFRDELNALSARYDELQKQQDAIKKEIDRTRSDKDKQVAIKQQLDNQIYTTRQQINLLNEKIALLESNIDSKQRELDTQEARIEDNYELMKKRLRVMYATGNASVLGLVLGAEDFSDFLSRTQIASRVSQHDRRLLEEMRVELAAIQAVKEEIESDKSEVLGARQEMAAKQTDLAGKLTETQSQIQDIEQLEREYKANQAALDKQMQEVQSEVDEIYKLIESQGEYEGGIMLWPVQGYQTVTSDYGWRFNGTNFHTGIDIARTNAAGQGIYGKPIRAAAAGRVVFTQTNYVAGRGYGIYLILDHGGGISTLYGHSSGLAVRMGDTVERGQTIAYVGSTGWSTGPHLHFEVRVNGVYTNPWPYLR